MPRLAKPTALLKFEKGRLYADQRDRAALEPKAEKESTPRCPRRFSKEERRAWKEIAAILKNYGLLTPANAIELELIATVWTQYLEVHAKMKQCPAIITSGPDGGLQYSMLFNALHRLGSLVDKYSQNLGLSSIALAKVGGLMLKARKKSAMEELLD
jgi:P27 family predicted phage terminase small subunit